jgi:hypothetical protein
VGRGEADWGDDVSKQQGNPARNLCPLCRSCNLYLLCRSCNGNRTPVYFGVTKWDRLAERIEEHSRSEPNLVYFVGHGQPYPYPPASVPAICEWLFCLAVEPEFQEDRLADYQERFANLWVPKFGKRGAVAVYLWHVLRQSRLIDWIVRACRVLDGS